MVIKRPMLKHNGKTRFQETLLTLHQIGREFILLGKRVANGTPGQNLI